jgi:hypothetical protein
MSHLRLQPAQDDPSACRAKCQEARVHGAHASPTSGSWPTVAEKRTFGKVFRSCLL